MARGLRVRQSGLVPRNAAGGSQSDLESGFWTLESNSHVRRVLLNEVVGKHEGATRFEFNMYAVVLDFDAATATVEDILTANGNVTVELESFLSRARGYSDDPSEGDGLTESQRHPPTFQADATGTVESIDRDHGR
jgi:hypothetical protein